MSAAEPARLQEGIEKAERAKKIAELVVRSGDEGSGLVLTRPQVWALARAHLRAEEALRDLYAWASRMPDAGFTDASPRWEWWNRGAGVLEKARAALAGESS